MSGLADLNLVLAALQSDDALHRRARDHLAREGRLTIPLSVGIELLLGARSRKTRCIDALTACDPWFEVEARDVLATAAVALDERRVASVFDAVHLAEALHRGERLHTADEALLRTRFPTTGF